MLAIGRGASAPLAYMTAPVPTSIRIACGARIAGGRLLACGVGASEMSTGGPDRCVSNFPSPTAATVRPATDAASSAHAAARTPARRRDRIELSTT